MRVVRSVLLLLVSVVLVLAGTGTATASTTASTGTGGYAPLDRPGPKLTVARADLDASLQCNGPLTRLKRNPVLLVPGTTMDPQVGFSWNYERAFDQLGWRWCTVRLPSDATGDIQVAGQYMVNALRTLHAGSGRKVDVVGWSQGGMVGRWALRFWPDTRPMVGDLVGLSPSNHGTVLADASCSSASSCTPANWQQASRSHFLAALNSGAETFAGIDYTVAYTTNDEIVVPNAGPRPSSALSTGAGRIANISLQSICPADKADHFAIGSYDPVGYAIVVDALTHPGPAVRSRIPLTTCAQLLQPGVDPKTFARDYAAFVAYALNPAGDAAKVAAEPPLAAYATR